MNVLSFVARTHARTARQRIQERRVRRCAEDRPGPRKKQRRWLAEVVLRRYSTSLQTTTGSTLEHRSDE